MIISLLAGKIIVLYSLIFTLFSRKPGTQNALNSMVGGIIQNQFTHHMAVQINLMFAVQPTNFNCATLVLHCVPTSLQKKKHVIVCINGSRLI